LKKNLAIMQNILDHIQCGIFVLAVEINTQESDVDAEAFTLRFTTANLIFTHLVFGERSVDQTVNLVGLQPKECLSLEFAEALHKYVSQCLKTQQVIKFAEKLDLLPNRVLSISLSLKVNENDRLLQIVGTCQDITKPELFKSQVADSTKQLEQNSIQLERELLKERELNELKSQFISRASHEFRTPLATIQTASD